MSSNLKMRKGVIHSPLGWSGHIWGHVWVQEPHFRKLIQTLASVKRRVTSLRRLVYMKNLENRRFTGDRRQSLKPLKF